MIGSPSHRLPYAQTVTAHQTVDELLLVGISGHHFHPVGNLHLSYACMSHVHFKSVPGQTGHC